MTCKSLICQKCGHMMDIDDNIKDFKAITCPACGSKEFIEESDAVKIAQIEAEIQREKLEAESKRQRIAFRQKMLWHLLWIIPALCLIIFLTVSNVNTIDTKRVIRKTIHSQWSDEDFKGIPYQQATRILEDAGFLYIENIPMNDLSDFLFFTKESQVDKVDRISIGGQMDFHKDAYFNSETFYNTDQVRIWYHSYPSDISNEPLENLPTE